MTKPLVLIEPHAHRPGGHHQRTLTALAEARPGSLVIAPYGVAGGLGPLREARARVITGASGPAAAVLLGAARTADRISRAGQRLFASRRLPTFLRRAPHQVTLVSRCLTEAACLRTARRQEPDPAAVVVLSASEALHGTAATLGGMPHLRFIHEAVTTEDLPLRLLGRLARTGEQRTRALYPTAAVRDQFTEAFPALACEVQPFAVDDGRRLTSGERSGARAAFDIPADAPAVCLIGGWWPYKAIDVISDALTRLTKPLHLVACGYPMDETVLDRWRDLPDLRVHTMPGPVSETILRLVYAACDAALIARRPGVAKESGLVMDAARLGVPLIVSEHDPALTTLLASREWAWTFPAEDPGALAVTLDRLSSESPARPGPGAPRALGMPTGEHQAAFLAAAYSRLLGKEH